MQSKEDFESVLTEIRNIARRYKKQCHLDLGALDVQDLRDDSSVLRLQLADIGAELYGDKIETAAAYEAALLRAEERIEEELRRTKTPNAADAAKRKAKLECLELKSAAIRADKINRLAINIYQFAMPDMMNSMASRIAVNVRYKPEDVNRKGSDYKLLSDEDEEFNQDWNDVGKVVRGIDNLERELIE